MGVYGYNPPTSEALPEGYIIVKVPEIDPENQGTQKLVDLEILYPAMYAFLPPFLFLFLFLSSSHDPTSSFYQSW
jgi:hypothetical protein